MDLSLERDRLFWQEITAYQQEKRMPFVTIAERVGMEKGKGEAFLEGIEIALKIKFGSEGLGLMPELREIQDHGCPVRSRIGATGYGSRSLQNRFFRAKVLQ
jgi:hypothetical protein